MSLGIINSAALGGQLAASAAAGSNVTGNKFSRFVGRIGGILDRVNEARTALAPQQGRSSGPIDLGRFVTLPAMRVETDDSVNRSMMRGFLGFGILLVIAALLFKRSGRKQMTSKKQR